MATVVQEVGAAPSPQGLGPVGWARWTWRTLTSMRTALLLLLLLALAAVPGSLLPQQGVNPGRVADYRSAHPVLAPWIDRLGGFSVYSSPWFSAVYLLLFASLVGCVVPRARVHLRTLRARPPATPRRLERLQEHRTATLDAPAEQVLTAARAVLGARRFRQDDHPGTGTSGGSVAAEKGYLKETGNLIFHIALLLLLVAFAVGHLFGFTGNRVVTVGESFGNGQYDSVAYGASAGPGDVVPFTLRLDDLDVRYQPDGDQRGAPRGFDATVRWALGTRSGTAHVAPNKPLIVNGDKVFLTGNGYSLIFTVRDSTGSVVSHTPTVFLPRDGNNTSTGAVKVPTAEGGLVFGGVFLPSEFDSDSVAPTSIYPDLLHPQVFLTGYTGIDASSSVYALDTAGLRQISENGQPWRRALTVGQTEQLPGNLGSIRLDEIRRFANFQVSNSTGNRSTLAAAALALLGLTMSLLMRQRRVWVRATAGPDGRTVVEVAGLGKGDSEGLGTEIDAIATELAGSLHIPEPAQTFAGSAGGPRRENT